MARRRRSRRKKKTTTTSAAAATTTVEKPKREVKLKVEVWRGHVWPYVVRAAWKWARERKDRYGNTREAYKAFFREVWPSIRAKFRSNLEAGLDPVDAIKDAIAEVLGREYIIEKSAAKVAA